MVMLCRSEGNWGEYGLSKAAVNCYTIELGKRYHATQLDPKTQDSFLIWKSPGSQRSQAPAALLASLRPTWPEVLPQDLAKHHRRWACSPLKWYLEQFWIYWMQIVTCHTSVENTPKRLYVQNTSGDGYARCWNAIMIISAILNPLVVSKPCWAREGYVFQYKSF